MMAAEDFQLIGRVQSGQVGLELFQLWQATGTFVKPQ